MLKHKSELAMYLVRDGALMQYLLLSMCYFEVTLGTLLETQNITFIFSIMLLYVTCHVLSPRNMHVLKVVILDNMKKQHNY